MSFGGKWFNRFYYAMWFFTITTAITSLTGTPFLWLASIVLYLFSLIGAIVCMIKNY